MSKEKWKYNIYALCVLIVVQIISLLLLKNFLQAFESKRSSFVMVGAIVICVGGDIFFFRTRIMALGYFLKQEPCICRTEDVIYIPYKNSDGRTRYSPFLLLRSLEDDKYYFTYGKYSLTGYNIRYFYSNNMLESCTIYKRGYIPLKIGDYVGMYSLKNIELPVSINQEKDYIKLKNKKYQFIHLNKNVDIDVFQQVVFFQGAIDVDIKIEGKLL